MRNTAGQEVVVGTRNDGDPNADDRVHINNLTGGHEVIGDRGTVDVFPVQDLQVLYAVEKLNVVPEQRRLALRARPML